MAGLEGLLAGRVLGGRYLIEEVIGRGGMGAVYRALDERLGRRVAVKVITLAGGDPEGVERLRARFHREARAAAALPHHPNVVPVYDYGTDEALGLDFIVMELLRGKDLASRLARSDAPPLATALRILLQAARGLAVGHRAGLIHRDVKPGNIFLAESDQREIQVRVVDFGIAKLVDDDDTGNQLTQDGRVPHSPAFASPEQLRGLSRLSAASDVFSLGAVGYLLLTAERPFTDADRNRMSLGMPVPPPLLRSSHPAIPAAIEMVVQKALSFDPEDRYPDAGAMHEALDEAIRSISDTTVEPYAGVHFDPPAAPLPPDEVDDDRTRLSESEAIAAHPGAPNDDRTQLIEPDGRTQVMEPDDRTLAAPSPRVVPGGGRPPRAFPSRTPPAPRKSRLGLIVWMVVLLGLAAVGVWAWMEANRPPQVTEVIPPPPDSIPDLSPDVSVEPVQEPSVMDAYSFNADGLGLFNRGFYDSALVYFRTAVEIVPDNADYRRNLGLTLRHLGEHEEAIQHLRRATELNPTLLIARFDLGNALLATGDTVGAIESLERFVTVSVNNTRMAVSRNLAIQKVRDVRAAQAAAAAAAAADSAAAAQDSVSADTMADSIAPVVPPGGF